ncbi:hypothetical protein I3842_09G006900 [Carya illinoinensis]|uniref:F-box domain-containing protein n=1 Tax=Carya illinoinensis TaxID=32201 RepID=A0A922E0B8_CARIL|nr:hypothetical protein I3842_09G006900 [Carya illinoinensis]
MGPGLGDIPESCVAGVLLYLTPQEICNLTRLNRAFRGVASSDLELLDLLPLKRYQTLSKKDILALLSSPVPFNHGNKQVLTITGIEDRRYWNWVPTKESRWEVKCPLPADSYTLSFRLHLGRFSKRLGRRVCTFEHTHGWDIKPVRFELFTSDGQRASSSFFLDDTEHDNANGNHKCGCWIDYKVSEFTVSDSEPATKVRFSMNQIDCMHSKGGLCVDSVFIIPSDLKSHKRRGVLK